MTDQKLCVLRLLGVCLFQRLIFLKSVLGPKIFLTFYSSWHSRFSSSLLPTNTASRGTHDGILLAARDFPSRKQGLRRMGDTGGVLTVGFPGSGQERARTGLRRPAG